MAKHLTAKEARRLSEQNELPEILKDIKLSAAGGSFKRSLYGQVITRETRKALKDLGYKVIKAKHYTKVKW